MHKLMNLLKRNVEFNKKKLDKDIKLFEKSKDTYWNRSYGKELIVIFNKNSSKSFYNIGFPFPLISEKITFKIPKRVSVMIFLTGDQVLQFQRKQLIEDLKEVSKVEFIEKFDLEEFRSISKKIFSKHKKFDYYDPYSFIGDSFIGLHFPETIELNFKIKLDKVYSENYNYLNSCINSMGYVGNLKRRKNFNVFVDLIANQWNRTKYLVRKRCENKDPSIIIGRDLIVIPTNRKIQIFYFKREGILLRDENIEDYMNECLSPFVTKIKKDNKIKNKVISSNFILNPFGSSELKTIPVDLVCNLIKNYILQNKDSKILIISGFKHNYFHLLWTAQLRNFVINKKLEKNIIIKDYGSFTEIKKDIKKYKMSIGITSDTSISHFFNYLNLLNFTFFNILISKIINLKNLFKEYLHKKPMKLILSGGGSGKQTKELDEQFANWVNKEKPLLYIPIAINNCKHPYSGCLIWLKSTFDNFGIKKYEVITEENLEEYSKKNVSDFGGIYIGGGNTFYLLKKLKESGMWEFLQNAIKKNIPVYGGSAGAIIFSKSIKPSLNFDKNWVELKELSGMNLIKGNFLFCHFNENKQDKINEIILRQKTTPAILLPENAGLVIENNNVKVIGKGKVFSKKINSDKKRISVL